MAFLTEDQQKELARFLELIAEKNSSVSFVKQAIDDIREKNRAGDKYAAADHSHDDEPTEIADVTAAIAAHAANPDAHHA